MNQQELVEAVIREVRRVLALRGVQIAPAPEVSSPALPRVAPAPSASVAAFGGDADLTGKQVIVLKDIQNFSNGSVRVARKAVVTPMAIDYAREKGITLLRVDIENRRETPAIQTTTVGLAIKPDFQGNSAMVRNYLTAQGFQIREIAGQSYEAAIQALGAAVTSNSVHFGICLENSGLLGPVHANRSQTVRAVHCRDLYEARAARVDIGANIIVLDAHSNPESVIAGFIGMG